MKKSLALLLALVMLLGILAGCAASSTTEPARVFLLRPQATLHVLYRKSRVHASLSFGIHNFFGNGLYWTGKPEERARLLTNPHALCII